MTLSRKYLAAGVAVAVAATALAVWLTREESNEAARAPEASGTLRNQVGAPGSLQAERPTAGELDSVRDQVTTWLVKNGFDGYRVSEVMAFANNDYIAVENSLGEDAFELLAAPGAGWLMLEPPSMLWNTRYGMPRGWQTNWSGSGMMPRLMGGGRAAGEWSGWYASGQTKVDSESKAFEIANAWLAGRLPGEQAEGQARVFPGYFTVDTTVGGEQAGMLSVRVATGDVWYHGWHGGFLAEREYPRP